MNKTTIEFADFSLNPIRVVGITVIIVGLKSSMIGILKTMIF